MTKPTVEDLVRPFETDRQRYVDFATRLDRLIVDLLGSAGLNAIQVDVRTKTVESLREKIERKNYQDPMSQTTDLIGLRIVAYYLEDVEKIGELISKEFHVHSEYSVKKALEFSADQFGYRSDHYVVSLDDPRNQLPEWIGYRDLKAEIQVRTALQHAWAAVDHKLNYKKIDDIPKELRRRLIRLSALFELADEEFSAIRNRRQELLEDRRNDVEDGNLSAKLDDISLAAYLKSIQSNILTGSRAHLKPVENSSEDYGAFIALSQLRELDITTIDELNETIGNDWHRTCRELDMIEHYWNEAASRPLSSVYYAITVLCMLRRFDTAWPDGDTDANTSTAWRVVAEAKRALV